MSAPPVILNPQQVVPLVSVSGHFNYESDVTALANGRSVITWADWFYNGTGYTQTIYARLLDAYGNQVGGIIAVSALSNSSSVPASHSPSVSALANGGFVIGFTRDYTNTDLDSYYRVYDATGGTVVGISAAAGGGDNEQTTDVVGLANGGWAVTYTNYSAGAGNVYSGYGVVYSIESVQQQNSGDAGSHIGLGTLAGAVIGGVVGSQVGSGRGTTVATVVGAAGGAYVGHEIENRKQQTSEADRITVRMNDGSYQSLMESTRSGFRVGDQVRIDNGVMQRY